MQIDQDKLKAETTNLVAAYREKNRQHQQIQELYNRLKRKEMTAQTQSAAVDSVDEVLGNVSSHQGLGCQTQGLPNYPSMLDRPQIWSQHRGPDGGDQMNHRGDSSNGSRGASGMMLPPPICRPAATASMNSVGPGMLLALSCNRFWS